jgi:COP9 signalosome complex subunit 7
LEHLITQAIYENIITATLNPASQTVIITSVAPLRDLAPGSVQTMIHALSAWSQCCDTALTDLESEIHQVKMDAEKRTKREMRTERQIKEVLRTGQMMRSKEEDDEDAMEVDAPGKKKQLSIKLSGKRG